MNYVEVEGKTYEEAVKKACIELNAKEEDLDIEVKEIDTKGILGILGSKKVRIIAKLKTKHDELETPEEYGKKFIKTLMDMLGLASEVTTKKIKDRIVFSLSSKEGNIFIGKNGEVMEAFQYILRLVIAKKFKQNFKLLFDINGYRERRRRALIDMAKRLSIKVKRTGKPVKTEPLNAYERRTIHTFFKNDKGIETRSEGEGPTKRVVISLRKEKRDDDGKR
ncbi:MAG: protein jag [Desulfobacterota bacterium]|nr:protein jag [Thermodesulfobacteriota bacterium]MDW8002621.1 RNA-binding cell elongation regulator Jag/EloR [Deltaproteobacteria bacterium]